jgi:divalent metal cation (Fe/Co/Zn/Cd) transporter
MTTIRKTLHVIGAVLTFVGGVFLAGFSALVGWSMWYAATHPHEVHPAPIWVYVLVGLGLVVLLFLVVFALTRNRQR